jgi:hypothetical protein
MQMPIPIEEAKMCLKTLGLFDYETIDTYLSFDVIENGQIATVCAFVDKRIVLLFLGNGALKYYTFNSDDEFSRYMQTLGCVLPGEEEKRGRCMPCFFCS